MRNSPFSRLRSEPLVGVVRLTKSEQLAVLEAVFGEPPHLAVPVEIDPNDALVDHFHVQERQRSFGALRNVIERFAGDGRDGRRRAEHDQHLFLRRPQRDLLQRPFGQHVTALGNVSPKQPPGIRPRASTNRHAAVVRRVRSWPKIPLLRTLAMPRIPIPPCVDPLAAVPRRLAIRNAPFSGVLTETGYPHDPTTVSAQRQKARNIASLYGMIVRRRPPTACILRRLWRARYRCVKGRILT